MGLCSHYHYLILGYFHSCPKNLLPVSSLPHPHPSSQPPSNPSLLSVSMNLSVLNVSHISTWILSLQRSTLNFPFIYSSFRSLPLSFIP